MIACDNSFIYWWLLSINGTKVTLVAKFQLEYFFY